MSELKRTATGGLTRWDSGLENKEAAAAAAAVAAIMDLTGDDDNDSGDATAVIDLTGDSMSDAQVEHVLKHEMSEVVSRRLVQLEKEALEDGKSAGTWGKLPRLPEMANTLVVYEACRHAQPHLAHLMLYPDGTPVRNNGMPPGAETLICDARWPLRLAVVGSHLYLQGLGEIAPIVWPKDARYIGIRGAADTILVFWSDDCSGRINMMDLIWLKTRECTTGPLPLKTSGFWVKDAVCFYDMVFRGVMSDCRNEAAKEKLHKEHPYCTIDHCDAAKAAVAAVKAAMVPCFCVACIKR